MRLPCRVGDVERDVDHVAAAMERQRLHDLVAVRRRSPASLQLDACRCRARARAARAAPRTACGGSACPSPMQARLRDERALGVALEREIRLGRVGRVAMLVERHQRDHAADGVDFGGVQIGLDRDLLARAARRGGAASAGARRRREWRRRRRARLRRRHGPSPARRVAARRRRRRCCVTGGGGGRVLLLPRLPQEERGEREDRRTG